MNIVIYSTSTCAYCKMLKDYLDSKKIKYDVKMADQDQKIAEELYNKSGQLGVPFTIITDDNNKQTNILGFDKATIDHTLGL